MQKRITLNRIDLTLILSIVIALEGLGKKTKTKTNDNKFYCNDSRNISVKKEIMSASTDGWMLREV